MAQRFQMASQSIQPSQDPSYKQSRAAQRIMYGTRRIDASDKQSAQDTTPSGRIARAKEAGLNKREIEQEENKWWRGKSMFGPQQTPEDFRKDLANSQNQLLLNPNAPKLQGLMPDPSIAQPQLPPSPGISTADDILNAYKSGATSGQFNLPNGGFGAFGPLPASTPPASSMASFLPNTIRPQKNYMSSVLDSSSRWTR